MHQIKSFKTYANNNKKSKEIEKQLIEKLINNGFIESNTPNLSIAIGGDGSFLKMVKNTNFNNDTLYVGINTGTLGFAQDINIENIDKFINDLKNSNYKVDTIGIQKTKIITNSSNSIFYSLNEIVIRDKELNTTRLNIKIDDNFLEKYNGDGILVATSFGSTAYNLSFGGSIIYNTFHTLQITPIAPLNNKKYRNLLNSVVLPENSLVEIIPENRDLLLTIDGENNIYENVLKIETSVKEKRIKILRIKEYNFIKKIEEKFLK